MQSGLDFAREGECFARPRVYFTQCYGCGLYGTKYLLLINCVIYMCCPKRAANFAGEHLAVCA
jgi:hypothetical protein